jgi:uncharacterized protein
MSARPDRNDAIGGVVQVGGSTAILHLSDGGSRSTVTVGNLIGIQSDGGLVVGVVTELRAETTGAKAAACLVDLMGEITTPGGQTAYRRGITTYPSLGDRAVRLTQSELEFVLHCPGEEVIRVGSLHQDEALEVHVKVDELIRKHFAVLGSTGVGKSSGVVVLVDQIMRAKSDLRIFFIDPHNEYGSSFGDRAEILTPQNLQLPFWLFNFEEFVDVLFRGRPGHEEETDILSELIPQAKAAFEGARASSDRLLVKRVESRATLQNASTPVPYRLADLIALIEERRGKLENRSLVFNYTRLLGRIETVRSDPRYGFMFDPSFTSGDTMADVLGQLFRPPLGGKPMTIMQLAGFPAEVVDCVVSVVCRMGFELGLWSDGSLPTLFLCEEAHRYAPADRTVGFGPTRKALSRIAKEGRKYGIFLGLVTQRPAELDATIVSQCSTIFAMRMANDRDQAILRAAASDAAAGLLRFIPSLATREAFAFGEGVPLPMRLRFTRLPPHLVPRSESGGPEEQATTGDEDADLPSIVRRWRAGGAARAALAEASVPSALTIPEARPPVLNDIAARPAANLSQTLRAFGAR